MISPCRARLLAMPTKKTALNGVVFLYCFFFLWILLVISWDWFRYIREGEKSYNVTTRQCRNSSFPPKKTFTSPTCTASQHTPWFLLFPFFLQSFGLSWRQKKLRRHNLHSANVFGCVGSTTFTLFYGDMKVDLWRNQGGLSYIPNHPYIYLCIIFETHFPLTFFIFSFWYRAPKI